PTSLPTGYSLVENLGSSFLTPGESTSFTVRLNAQAAGSYEGTISVVSNDQKHTPFRILVRGKVYDPTAPVMRIMDDGNLGHSKLGPWKRVTTQGYGGDQSNAVAGSGVSLSTWKFEDLANGVYQIQATWKAASGNATDAQFTLLNGSQIMGRVRTDQRVAPSDLWDGAWWENLGTVVVTEHQLTVRLNNNANGSVVADAIRIEKFDIPEHSLPIDRVTTGFIPSIRSTSPQFDLNAWALLASNDRSIRPTVSAVDSQSPNKQVFPSGARSLLASHANPQLRQTDTALLHDLAIESLLQQSDAMSMLASPTNPLFRQADTAMLHDLAIESLWQQPD
ncbi:MAG: hypothetical protein SGJ20_05170, partial [Planctomycetota bacterium]|nr:hypothetical protein [Planctomycetota bacterium]